MANVIIPGPNRDQIVDEKNSCYLEFDLLDPNDKTGNTKIPGPATTGTLNLDFGGTSILSGIDVKNDLDANGHFKHLLTDDNNAIISTDDPGPHYEDHIATVTIAASAGGDTHNFVKNIRVRVMNLKHVT